MALLVVEYEGPPSLEMDDKIEAVVGETFMDAGTTWDRPFVTTRDIRFEFSDRADAEAAVCRLNELGLKIKGVRARVED